VIYQFVWTTTNDDDFEQMVPILWHGEHLQRNGWSNGIVLCFLEGIELLSKSYLRQLDVVGYTVLDCREIAASHVNGYPGIEKLSRTSQYWFLRWNILKQVTTQNSDGTNSIHLDGDVVLMCEPRMLINEVEGKTFMLQGCPAFTAINDRAWFNVWQKEMSLFLADRTAYINKALLEKKRPHRADREFCNICAYKPGRFEDQDMLEFLIAAGKLPQASSEEVYNSNFYWIQNPLFPGEWYQEQIAGAEKRIIERKDGSFVGGKRVPFYHFQTDFAIYCRNWLYLTRLGQGWLAEKMRFNSKSRRQPLPAKFATKILDVLNKKMCRRKVYEVVFQRNPRTGNHYITDIVNSCWD
jgi:hypothetical protein